MSAVLSHTHPLPPHTRLHCSRSKQEAFSEGCAAPLPLLPRASFAEAGGLGRVVLRPLQTWPRLFKNMASASPALLCGPQLQRSRSWVPFSRCMFSPSLSHSSHVRMPPSRALRLVHSRQKQLLQAHRIRTLNKSSPWQAHRERSSLCRATFNCSRSSRRPRRAKPT